jgi:hypothetical protein
MFLLLAGLVFSGVIVYKRKTIRDKYKKFRELNNLVATRTKSVSKILWISLCMVSKMYWRYFLQWLNDSVEIIDHKNAVVTYVLHDKIYKLPVKVRRGPNLILLITDEHKNDVTDEITPFFGPEQNWHNKQLSPDFWKRESLTFELSSGETKTFHKDEIICL